LKIEDVSFRGNREILTESDKISPVGRNDSSLFNCVQKLIFLNLLGKLDFWQEDARIFSITNSFELLWLLCMLVTKHIQAIPE